MRRPTHTFAIFICLAVLSACGFKPMAAVDTKDPTNAALASALASVDVTTHTQHNQRLIAQRFQTKLEDLLNPGKLNSNSHRYTMSIHISHRVNPGFIAPDGKAQRFVVDMRSSFTLQHAADGSIIDQGTLQRSSSYSNLPNSYFSTYVAEQDTLKRLAEQLAEEYRLKLASLLANPPEKPSPEPEEFPEIPEIRPESAVIVPGF